MDLAYGGISQCVISAGRIRSLNARKAFVTGPATT